MSEKPIEPRLAAAALLGGQVQATGHLRPGQAEARDELEAGQPVGPGRVPVGGVVCLRPP